MDLTDSLFTADWIFLWKVEYSYFAAKPYDFKHLKIFIFVFCFRQSWTIAVDSFKFSRHKHESPFTTGKSWQPYKLFCYLQSILQMFFQMPVNSVKPYSKGIHDLFHSEEVQFGSLLFAHPFFQLGHFLVLLLFPLSKFLRILFHLAHQLHPLVFHFLQNTEGWKNCPIFQPWVVSTHIPMLWLDRHDYQEWGWAESIIICCSLGGHA